jgi:tRNA(Arg) A34 adenosine deaminase TadA
MDQKTNEHWIREAIRLASEARNRGDEPFGSLLVHDGVSVLEARNAVNTDRDVTQHAELRLISRASKRLDPAVLSASTLYTSTEPCAMCAGSIYWAGVPRLVFGLAATTFEQITGGTGLHQPSRQVLGAASRLISIDGPILEDEARKVHLGFW